MNTPWISLVSLWALVVCVATLKPPIIAPFVPPAGPSTSGQVVAHLSAPITITLKAPVVRPAVATACVAQPLAVVAAAPVIPPAATFLFQEAERLHKLAQEASCADLSFDVAVDAQLSLGNATAFGLARHFYRRAEEAGWSAIECRTASGECALGIVEAGGDGQSARNDLLAAALTSLESAWSRSGMTSERAGLSLGRGYLAAGRPEAALLVYFRLLALHRASPRVHLGAAIAMHQLGLDSPARVELHLGYLRKDPALMAEYREAIKAGPADADGLDDLVEGHYSPDTGPAERSCLRPAVRANDEKDTLDLDEVEGLEGLTLKAPRNDPPSAPVAPEKASNSLDGLDLDL